ncbi:MAG TPA: hypothetical protein DCW68_00175 [Rhodospirillaceae bacterium]|nr:MAG: hypothetical protein A2018_01490 [Alphaproteobacteria bacterium GWF2_58_20]HAU28516.1 hypothetical protein [Rhodospirillaceae bacterium]
MSDPQHPTIPRMKLPICATNDSLHMDCLLEAFCSSRYGHALLESAYHKGYRISLDHQGVKVPLAKYNDKKKIITLPAYMPDGMILMSLAMALRGIAQDDIHIEDNARPNEKIYVIKHSDFYNPTSQILVNRLRKADQVVAAFDIAEEISKSGHASNMNPATSMKTALDMHFIFVSNAYAENIRNDPEKARRDAFKAFYKEVAWLPSFDSLVLDRIEKMERKGFFKDDKALLQRELAINNMSQTLEKSSIPYFNSSKIHFGVPPYNTINSSTKTRLKNILERLKLPDDNILYEDPDNSEEFAHVDNEDIRCPSVPRIDLKPEFSPK